MTFCIVCKHNGCRAKIFAAVEMRNPVPALFAKFNVVLADEILSVTTVILPPTTDVVPVNVAALKVPTLVILLPPIFKSPDIVSPAFKTFNDAAPVTLPVKFAVIVPAVKLPDASLATIVLAVFAFVAVVAEFDTFPAVEIVANFESTIAAEESTSAFTIKDELRFPDESLCTTPAEPNPFVVSLIETVPAEEIDILCVASVINDIVSETVAKPEVVLPVNCNDGFVVVPAGICKSPVNVPPVNAKFPDAVPVKSPVNVVAPIVPPLVILLVAKLIAPPIVKPVNVTRDVTFAWAAVVNVPAKFVAVIVPAVKLPEASRATIVLAVFAFVASVETPIVLALFVIVTCVPPLKVLNSRSLPVFCLNTCPSAPPTLLAVTAPGDEKIVKATSSVPTVPPAPSVKTQVEFA